MKQILAIVYFLIVYQFGHSQTPKPAVVTTSGAVLKQGSINLDFTVGELTVKSLSDSNITSIGQGFISSSAPPSVNVIPTYIAEQSPLKIRVYPNPASELIFADVSANTLDKLQLAIYDMTGRLLSKEIYASSNNHIGISTQNWPPGSYLLVAEDLKGNEFGKFKIIKP